MLNEDILNWLEANPQLAPWVIGGVVALANLVVFVIARYLLARAMIYLAQRTESKYDDIIVEELRPFRFAWIAPLLLTYGLAGMMMTDDGQLTAEAGTIQKTALILILWLVIITINALLNAVNTIYESSESYRGLSIQGYLDLVKILLIITGGILTVSMFTGESPVALLSGLGAVMALILLVFRDTLLSFVASLQIQSQDLVREGDWIEMPAYEADGDVINVSLHTVRVRNWDNTFTVIPTYKFLDTPYKNWRGMQESGGRRVKRAINLDLNSIRFCDQEMIDRFCQIDLVKPYVERKMAQAGPSEMTNAGVFRAYVYGYLKRCPDLHQEGMTLLVRQLDPSPTGLPIEVYAFTKTTDWVAYEMVQADIFEHLVAAASQFDLQVFQEPAGADFRMLTGSVERPGGPD